MFDLAPLLERKYTCWGNEFEGDARIEGEARLSGGGVWGSLGEPLPIKCKNIIYETNRSVWSIFEAEINLFPSGGSRNLPKMGSGFGN